MRRLKDGRPRPRGSVIHPLLALIVVGAYVMAHALAAPGLPWLGCLALIPLLRAVQVQRPGAALLSGAVWGAGLFLFSTTVVATPIRPTVLSFGLLTVSPAAYAFLGACLARRIGFSPFVLGVGWMLLEFVFQPLGLSRGLLAGTQGNGALLGVVGQLLGYVLVAFVVAYASALLLNVVSGIRIRCDSMVCISELADAGYHVWTPARSHVPALHHRPSRPRAPPAAFFAQ